MRLIVPIAALVQVFTGAGLVLGFGILIDDPEPRRMMFLSTGAVVISLITVGLVMAPQQIAQQRIAGQYEYITSLPVPRSAATCAWLSVSLMIAVPGAVAALLVAALRFDLEFYVSVLVVPAVLLVVAAATLIGYAYSISIRNARLVMLVAQITIFVVFGFSPIGYPAQNLPGWLQRIHAYLPFESMATTVRASLANGFEDEAGRAFMVVAAWTLAAVGLAAWTSRRRR